MRKIPLFFLTSAALAAAHATVVQAQQNELFILQDGIGNSLSVDQSEASFSSVRGLTIESLQPDLDSDDLSGSVSFGRSETALQSGSDNVADITITGSGGVVRLLQDNEASDGAGNQAFVTANAGANAIVGQSGSGNVATVNVTGVLDPVTTTLLSSNDGEVFSNSGILTEDQGLLVDGTPINGVILQSGNGNLGTVIAPAGSQGTLVQLGSRNESTLDLTPPGSATSVVYTQIGNNLTSLTEAQVVSNAIGTVAITQTNLANGVTTNGSVTVTQTTR